MNKKYLYETIMKGINRSLKKSINEMAIRNQSNIDNHATQTGYGKLNSLFQKMFNRKQDVIDLCDTYKYMCQKHIKPKMNSEQYISTDNDIEQYIKIGTSYQPYFYKNNKICECIIAINPSNKDEYIGITTEGEIFSNMFHLRNQAHKHYNVIFEYLHTENTYDNQCRIDVFHCTEDFMEDKQIWGQDIREMRDMLTLLNNNIDKCCKAVFDNFDNNKYNFYDDDF